MAENEGSHIVEIGSIFRMNLDEKDDVSPKDRIDFRPKFLVVIGSAEYGYYVAYVLVNKSINEKYNYSKELKDCQFPLHVKDYPDIFKIDPSYVNLARIREMEKERLLKEAIYQRKLTEGDLELIMETLRTSKVLTTKEKKRYGLMTFKGK